MISPSVDVKLEGSFSPTNLRGEFFSPGPNPVDVVVSATGASGPVDLATIALPEAPFTVIVDLTGSGEDEVVVSNAPLAGTPGTRVRFSQMTFAGADALIRRAAQRSVEDVEVNVNGQELAKVKCPMNRECEIRFEFRR